jgi:cation diffusion facilitator family transporter
MFWSVTGNLLLAIVKLFGGILAESSGLVADGVQSFSCVIGCIVIMYSLTIAKRRPDKHFPYGYGKVEFLAALKVFTVLLAVGFFTSALSMLAIARRDFTSPDVIALPIAVFSIFLNYLMYKYSLCGGTRLKSSGLVANAYQEKADMLSSCAVCVGIVLAQLGGDFEVCDPLAAFVVGVIIIKDSYYHWVTNLKAILDNVPEPGYQEKVGGIVSEVLAGRLPCFVKVKRTGSAFWLGIGLDFPDTDTVQFMQSATNEIEAALRHRMKWIESVDFFLDGPDAGDGVDLACPSTPPTGGRHPTNVKR